jgi:hypothetical protein
MQSCAALVALFLLLNCAKQSGEAEPRSNAGNIQTTAEIAPKGAPLPVLAKNAPVDKPVSMSVPPTQLAELTAAARKTYLDAKARYLRGLPEGEHFFVTRTLSSPGEREYVFIAVSKIRDGKVIGTIASDILHVKGFKSGDAYTFAEADIEDWLITKPDGSEEGNAIGKLLDTLQ